MQNDTVQMFLSIMHVLFKIVNETGNLYWILINLKAKIVFLGIDNGLARSVSIFENGKETKLERVENLYFRKVQ